MQTQTFSATVPKHSENRGFCRYGFNGKEKDDEVYGVDGSFQDYGMRMYDTRVSRFWGVDPITAKYPELTPYQFASNSAIRAIDLDGFEAVDPQTGIVIRQEIYEKRRIRDDIGYFYTGTKLSNNFKGKVTTIMWSQLGPTNRASLGTELLLNGCFSAIIDRNQINKTREAITPAVNKVSEIIAMNKGTTTANEKSSIATDGIGKAFRHIAAQALITKLYGETTAKVLGDYQERVNPNSPEVSARDLMNNEYGRQFSASYKGELKTASDFAGFLNAASDYVLKSFDMPGLTDAQKFKADSPEVKALYKNFTSEKKKKQ